MYEETIQIYWQLIELLTDYLDGRKCSHFLANYNSLFKLIFKQSRV